MFRPKFKVCFQTKSNVWQTSKIFKKFNKSKWSFINLLKKKDYRHYSLRQNDVLRAKLNTSFFDKKFAHLKNERNRRIKALIFYRRNQENFFMFNLNHNFQRKFALKKFSSFSYFLRDLNKKKSIFEKQFLYKKMFKYNLLSFQKSRKTYGKINLKTFKKFSYKFFGYKPLYFYKKDSFLYQKKIDSFLFYFNFGLSIFHIQNLIKYNFFKINNQRIKDYNFIIKKGDFLQFDFLKSSVLMKQLLWKLYKKPLFYKKSLLFNNGEMNWNTLNLIAY